MTETEKMFAGKLYDPFCEGMPEARRRAHELCLKYNQLPESDEAGRAAILDELMPDRGEGVYLQGPIQFDFGAHIRMGRGSYANFNFVVLDENRVTIGPGCVVGAGSVVTRDIPADSLAAGNPCRVLRLITEADRMASHPERMA